MHVWEVLRELKPSLVSIIQDNDGRILIISIVPSQLKCEKFVCVDTLDFQGNSDLSCVRNIKYG